MISETALSGLLGLGVTLVGALIMLVWRASSLVTELKKAAEAVALIPTLQARLAQLEDAVLRTRSDIKELRRNVQGARERLASITDPVESTEP